MRINTINSVKKILVIGIGLLVAILVFKEKPINFSPNPEVATVKKEARHELKGKYVVVFNTLAKRILNSHNN